MQKLILRRLSVLSTCLFVSLIMSSCESFLEVGAPKSEIESDIVFGNDVTATSAVLGVYSQLLKTDGFVSGTPSSVLALTGLSSDELVNYSRVQSFVEFEENSISPSNSYVMSLWQSLYRSIYQVNSIVEGINGSSGLSDHVRRQLIGESLFVRAFCYFYLVNIYGDVPLVISTDYQKNAAIPRTSSDVIYEQILEDLQIAHDYLADEYSAAYGERIRPNKFSASALLARLYLYKKDWQNAEVLASEVIGNSETYMLTDSVQDVFLMNSIESIWQLRPTISADRGYTYEALYFSPRNALKYNVLRPNSVKLFEEGDRRFRHWIEYVVVGADTVYYPRKYKQDQFSGNITEYSSMLRLAEQYLIRAEARAMQDKLLGENSAESDVNVIRVRAGLPTIEVTTQADIMGAILNERRVELVAEGGHRWFDLKRLGIAEQILGTVKNDFDGDDELYPLPASEFRSNPLLKRQNEGY